MVDYLDLFNRYIMGSIQMLTGFHFLTRFLKRKVNLIYYLLFAAVGIALMMVVRAGSIAEIFAYILLLIAGGIFVCKADCITVVLYAVVTAEIMQLCYGIFNSALCIFYPWINPLNQEAVGIAFMVLGNMALPAAVFCYHMMYHRFPYDETVKNQYVLMLLTPTLMIFLIGEYISFAIYGNTITTDGGGNVLNADHYHMLVIQLLGMASLFCIMTAYKKLLENFRLSTDLSLLEQEEHSLNQYVEEVKTRYEKTRAFRHDVKNHITVVRDFLQNGKLEQALNYIGEMDGITEELSFPCSTNNPVADIVIGNKLGIAKSIGLDVRCSLTLPYPCSVRDIDFGIILSNALDNAIHACKSIDNSAEKYIYVTGRVQGDFVLLEIENSFQERGVLKEGTGLSNIKTIVEKYHGAMNIKAQDKAFVLSVLLIIPQHSESTSQQIC